MEFLIVSIHKYVHYTLYYLREPISREKYKEEETSEKMKRDVNERHKCKHTET